jgi:hypothetical protein
LQDQDLSVDEPDGDDGWPSVSEQLADNAEGAPITIRATGWNDISLAIRSAFAKFQDRFPGQAAIRDQDETP